MEKIRRLLKKALLFILNPKLILCLGFGWIITNGWSYVVLTIGTLLDIKWMVAVGGGYVAFLWFPMSPEKIVTVAIAIGLLRILFPNDTKTLGVLKQLNHKVKAEYMKLRKKSKKTKKTPTYINGAPLYKCDENIYKLEVPFYNIYTAVFMVKNGDKTIIIDTADKVEDAENYILPALKEIGVKKESVTAILLTHTHGDHTGGAARLAAACENAKIYSFADHNPYSKDREFKVINDGEIIEDCIKAVTLKGHENNSGGYLCLPSKTFISGDSIQLYGLDVYAMGIGFPKEYLSSLKKLLKMDMRKILASHEYSPLGSEATRKSEVKRYLRCAKECLLDLVDFVRMKSKEGITDAGDLEALFIKERAKIYEDFPTANFKNVIEAVKREYM